MFIETSSHYELVNADDADAVLIAWFEGCQVAGYLGDDQDELLDALCAEWAATYGVDVASDMVGHVEVTSRANELIAEYADIRPSDCPWQGRV